MGFAQVQLVVLLRVDSLFFVRPHSHAVATTFIGNDEIGVGTANSESAALTAAKNDFEC